MSREHCSKRHQKPLKERLHLASQIFFILETYVWKTFISKLTIDPKPNINLRYNVNFFFFHFVGHYDVIMTAFWVPIELPLAHTIVTLAMVGCSFWLVAFFLLTFYVVAAVVAAAVVDLLLKALMSLLLWVRKCAFRRHLWVNSLSQLGHFRVDPWKKKNYAKNTLHSGENLNTFHVSGLQKI